ncbi:hypothetical protein MMC07_000900 [Pseudocyphellaria aurata]|nr:hypothetical protein [Pseudocyphellaria aurata]
MSSHMTWDVTADHNLLLAVLAENTVAVNYAAVAARLGPRCTSRAVQERLRRLRKAAAKQFDENEAAEAAPAKGRAKVSKTTTKKNDEVAAEAAPAKITLKLSKGKKPVQQPKDEKPAQTSPVKGKAKSVKYVKKPGGKAAKVVKKDGKSAKTELAAGELEKGKKRGATDFIVDEEIDGGGKRIKLDDEDYEASTEEDSSDIESLDTEN